MGFMSVRNLLYVIASIYASSSLCAGKSSIGRNYSSVLVGGGLHDDNVEVWSTIIALGGGVGVARFGVISAASEDPCCGPDSSWVYYRDLLTKYGAAEVYYIPVTVDSTEENSNPDVVAHIRTLTGFFFGGGDQTRIISSFYNEHDIVPSPVLVAIRETLLATGGVIAGTSAGTDCLTLNSMITGGVSYNAVVNGTTVLWTTKTLPDEDILTAYGRGGIGVFPHGILDTHFANRGRQGRLVQLLADTSSLPLGSQRAFGVDENTALVVTGSWGQRIGTAIGQRGVMVFDISHATYGDSSNSDDLNWTRLFRISKGDSIDLNNLDVSFADYKTAMADNETLDKPETSTDVFAEDTFQFDVLTQTLLQSKASTTYGVSKESNPQVRVEVRKTTTADHSWLSSIGSAIGYGYAGTDPVSGEYAYGYVGLWLQMTTVN